MISLKGVKPTKFENGEDAPAWCALACAYIAAGHASPEKAADAMLAEFRSRAGRMAREEEPEATDEKPEEKTDESAP